MATKYLPKLHVRHVALLQIQGKEFELRPIPLRTVRPFVLEDVVLSEVAEEEKFDISDQMEVTKYLKGRVKQPMDLSPHQQNNDDDLIYRLTP